MKSYDYNAYTLDASVYCVTCGPGPKTNGAQRVYNCGHYLAIENEHQREQRETTRSSNRSTTIPIEIEEIPTRV